MRTIRITQTADGCYVVEKRMWWWPFWTKFHWCSSLTRAQEAAERVANPVVEYIK